MLTKPSRADQEALAALATPLGGPGSGRVRYAAAMYFNRCSLLSDEVLEVYRVCSARDGDDPHLMLGARRLGLPAALIADPSPGALIRTLVDEIDCYLADLSGPGAAECRQGLALWQNGPVAALSHHANPLVAECLGPALASLRPTHPALAASIGAAAAWLPWHTYDGYPPDAIGADFAQGHAYASLIGEDAPLPAEDWELGLFLIRPHVLYRDHCHPAPELYAPLTGPHGWRFGAGQPLRILPAHRPVWNAPHAPHLTKVGPDPFLCVYIWTSDVNASAKVIPANDWPTLAALRLEP